MADMQSGSNITVSPDGTGVDNGTGTISNGTLPYPHHHHHHHINLVGVLVGILIPHVVCTLFVLARAWSRLVLLRKWFIDDTLMVGAWLCSTAVCIVYAIASREMAGQTYKSALNAYLLRTYLGLIFYQLCLCLTKLAILTLYLRMFTAGGNRDSRPRRERRLTWLTIVVVIAYGLPMLWMSIQQCYPGPGQFFGRSVGLCFTFTQLLVASASLHTVTDAWLILLVVPFVLTRLSLPTRQRWALAAVLSLGIFVIAASLTRLQLSLRGHYRPHTGYVHGPDRASTLGFFVMTILELDIALICASAPTLRPLLAKIAPRWGLGDDSFSYRNDIYNNRNRRRTRRFSRYIIHHPNPSDDSVDLTSVVSYHGYPWTRTHTPLRSRSKNDLTSTTTNAPVAAGGGTAYAAPDFAAAMPAPPASTFAPGDVRRTPTARSLRSFVSGIAARSGAPRSRGGISATSAGNNGNNNSNNNNNNTFATHHNNEDEEPLPSGLLSRRPSSVFFENSDFDHYFSEATPKNNSGNATKDNSTSNTPSGTGTPGKKKAGVPGAGIGLGIILQNKHWNGSQESFVMGNNDPASPTRLTRLTGISGYSGETYTEEHHGESHDGESLKHDKIYEEEDKEEPMEDLDGEHEDRHERNKETSFLDDDEAKLTQEDDHSQPAETSFLDDETDNDEETQPPMRKGH